MLKIIVPAILALASVGAVAQSNCFGSGNMRTCTDSSGSTYNVQRFGNTTHVQGYNAQTGNSWNQTSQTYGNTTYHNGTAGNGNSWSGTDQTYGGTTYRSGIDSRGNAYSRTCNAYGCF